MKEETMVINEFKKKRKNFDEFNMWWGNRLVNTVVSLLDDLRDESKKEVNNICSSFAFTKNDTCKKIL